jgi:hypothetical protein
MKTELPIRQEAKVEMHLNGGFTRVSINFNRHQWDIPTDKIPPHLRRIGSKFIVVMPIIRPELSDSADAIREALVQLEIEEL